MLSGSHEGSSRKEMADSTGGNNQNEQQMGLEQSIQAVSVNAGDLN